MRKLYRLTQAGVDELKSEQQLLISRRADVADAIRTARELGDLSENAEYQAARADQERSENRISEIENIVQNVDIITKPPGGAKGKVQLGSTVTLKNGSTTKEFQVVGTVEADPLNGKISDESPIGRALMGKKMGEEVQITTPADTTSYTVAAIN